MTRRKLPSSLFSLLPLCSSTAFSYDSWTDVDIKSWLSAHALMPTPTKATSQRTVDSIRRYYDDAYKNWSEADLRGWLEVSWLAVVFLAITHHLALHRIIVSSRSTTFGLDFTKSTPLTDLAPKTKSTREELLESVQSNWDSARSYVGSAADRAQQAFNSNTQRSAIVDTWTDSELRAFVVPSVAQSRFP